MHRDLTVTHRTSILRDAIDVIDREYATELSLDEVAHRIATSRRQLQRCFEEHWHLSFREHVTHVRMTRAAQLLTGTSLTVREVAASVGYRQPAQFAKSFRARYGRSPAEYRGAPARDVRELVGAGR